MHLIEKKTLFNALTARHPPNSSYTVKSHRHTKCTFYLEENYIIYRS